MCIRDSNCLDEEEYHNVYQLLNRQSKEELIDHLEIHFIELEKYNKDLSEVQTALDRWTEFLKRADQYDKDQIPSQLAEVESIEKAIKVLDTIGLTKEEREVYEARLKWLRDEEMALKKAERKGMERGIERGIEKGIEKIVKSMLEKGIGVEEIIQMTDLDKESVNKIKESYNI